MAATHHYLLVLSGGPFIAVRVPWPMPRWRHVLRALTGVMWEHGLRQKDITSVEGLVAMPDQLGDLSVKAADEDERMRALFDSKLGLRRFYLYDWTDAKGGSFRLFREPLE